MYYAIETENKLLCVTLVGWSLGIIMLPLIVLFLRREIRPEGSFLKLTKGEKIAYRLKKDLVWTERMVKMLAILFLAISQLGFGFILVMGSGVHSPAYNRVSAAVQMGCCLAAAPLTAVCGVALQTVITVAQHKVSHVIRKACEQVDNGLGESHQEWEQEFVAPILQLATTMLPLLSKWTTPLMIATAALWAFSIAFLALSINPALGHIMVMLGLDFVPTSVGRALAMFTAVTCASIPLVLARSGANVSTLCHDLMSELNNIRLMNMSAITHQRLLVIETALSRLNEGQGLGLVFGQLMIDNSLLNRMVMTLRGLAVTLLPLMWAWTSIHDKPSNAPNEACAHRLTDSEQSAWLVFARQFNSSCTFNVSLGPHGFVAI